MKDPLKVCLFGAPGSNTNLGLNALMHGTMAAAAAVRPDVQFTVFDNELGVRNGSLPGPFGPIDFRLIGARLSRRVTRQESYAAMTAALPLRGWRNPGARAVLESDLVLDVSGGDSFSDIYGDHRFQTVSAPKRLAQRARRPLVLLPQTYGPFSSVRASRAARALVLGAEQAWARDPDSLAVLEDLLGDDLDRSRHRLGVDLAVMLPPAGRTDLPPEVEAMLERAPVGVNVSGLLWNQAERFDLRADYRTAMHDIVRGLVGSGHEVLLVPHVLGRRRGGEADNVAAADLLTLLPDEVRRRVLAVPWLTDAAQAKSVVGRCCFLVGTRMHSTIAALSSGTPCVAIAYSPKYGGVFHGFGARESVLDARALPTAELVAAALAAVERREEAGALLGPRVAAVRDAAERQMRQILGAAEGSVSSAA